MGNNFSIITGWTELIGTEKAVAFVFDTQRKKSSHTNKFLKQYNKLAGSRQWPGNSWYSNHNAIDNNTEQHSISYKKSTTYKFQNKLLILKHQQRVDSLNAELIRHEKCAKFLRWSLKLSKKRNVNIPHPVQQEVRNQLKSTLSNLYETAGKTLCPRNTLFSFR